MLADVTEGLQAKLSTQSITRNREAVPPSKLSGRELEIIGRIATGLTNKEVAAELGISARTIEHHRNRLRIKLKVKSPIDLVRYAIRDGLVPL
jgi:DNA-binding NarL/FixJ family response regulator